MKITWTRIIGSVIGLILFIAALWVLYHQLKTYPIRDIIAHLHNLPAEALVLAILLTFFSYLTMTGYDTWPCVMYATLFPMPKRPWPLLSVMLSATVWDFQ